MNKYEFMRRMICGLCIWNLILTIGFFTTGGVVCKSSLQTGFTPFEAAVNKEQMPTPTSSPVVNEQICELEMIPTEELL